VPDWPPGWLRGVKATQAAVGAGSEIAPLEGVFGSGILLAELEWPRMMSDTPSENDVEKERLLIEAVVALARTLRDERDRLAERLREVEQELHSLSSRLDGKRPEASSADATE
jgi:hypothetical protein